MTSGFFPRRLALLAAVSSSLWLAACGGGGSGDGGGTASLRAINLTTDLPSVDLYTNDTKRFSALAPDTMAAGVSLDAATYSLSVRKAGEATSLYSEQFAFAKDRHFTALITGRESTLLVRTLPEDDDSNNISAGRTKVRVFNMTADTAGVDVFITSDTTDIGDTNPTLRFTSTSLSDYVDLATATYRLRVTTVGNPNQVRLDIPLTGLPEKQYSTLVLTSGLGGTLVNATLIPQQGNPTALKNTRARVRVAAGADSAGNVSASIAGATFVGSLRSPLVNDYALIASGTQDLTVRINGTVISTGARNFVAGADYTLLVYGNAVTGQAVMLSDDNRLPNTSTRAKIRLVNGVANSSPQTMQLDYFPLATDVAFGTASAYSTANSAGSSRVEVSSNDNATDPLYVNVAATGAVLLQPQSVYTLFMLGGQAAPTGVFRRDR